MSVGVYEAKTHLAKLLDRVSKGERIVITRHGVPIAELIPADPAVQRDTAEVVRAIREFRRGRRLGANLRALIEEGRA